MSFSKLVPILITSLFMCFSLNGRSQESLKLQIIASIKKDYNKISRLKYSSKSASKELRAKEINNALIQLYAESYVEAQIDSSIIKERTEYVYISLNKKYKWHKLSKGNLDQVVINDINFNESDYNGQGFNYNKLLSIEESIIIYFENHGYPFASIALDSISIIDQQISAAFKLIQGPLIYIDTINIKGFTDIHPKYLYQLMDVKPGDVYNESKIKRINQQLASMNFAQELNPFTIAFTPKNATINLELQKQKINMFDGIIGFQPNSGSNNDLVLTGNLRLKLVNSFKRGELISINWRSPQGGSQNLDIGLAYPYLFNTPIGIDYEFKLLKQDSSFINIRNKPGVSFLLNAQDYVKLSANLFSSQTLSSSATNNNPIPKDILDMRSSIFNLELNINRLNYIPNPRKGWFIKISGGFGTKDIVKQHNIDESFYDSIPLNTNQFQFNAQVDFFIPIFKRQTLRIANLSGLLEGDYLLSNELFRIGGFSDLRGFDEESLYASTFSIMTFEWRLLLERNSYINVFWNGAYTENNTQNNTIYDQPMGFGAGISFQTKAGIFALSYALGKQLGNPIEFNSGKIHFGYMARF